MKEPQPTRTYSEAVAALYLGSWHEIGARAETVGYVRALAYVFGVSPQQVAADILLADAARNERNKDD